MEGDGNKITGQRGAGDKSKGMGLENIHGHGHNLSYCHYLDAAKQF